MTPERAQAYGRLMRTLNDLAGSKLHGEEEDSVREAADTLIFSEDLDVDPAAREALDEVRSLAERLVDAERVMPDTAERLVSEAERCSPLEPVG